MSKLSDTLNSPSGRTALLSGLIALILLFIAFVIPLAENSDSSFYKLLYEDLTTPEKDRFNWKLVILESVLLTLFFFFSLIFLGSLAELRNNLPSWGEVFLAGFITLILAFFFVTISVGGGLTGTNESSGFTHFTSDMRKVTYLFTVIGIILMTLYTVKSESPEQK